ncbi:MAG: RagB/SusD family nutrient uptake outer membrane protein [Prolixibacteraceae bacterium]|jgi:hypothetical protein|nr:RagB/SusD family nutrient uptake outer membrane protein [Prolixibacteraceae bacterium]
MRLLKNIFVFLLLSQLLGSCKEEILNLKSLTAPDNATFFSNEQELQLALTGVYRSILILDGGYGLPIGISFDNGMTDIGISRTASTLEDVATGIQSSSTAAVQAWYSTFYKGITQANNLLVNMDKVNSKINETVFNQIKAQALFIRAYHYHNLIELYGDVPYIDFVATSPEEALLPRMQKQLIVVKLLADLQIAADALPNKWADAEKGRVTKGSALALRARIALYNKNYTEAAASAKAVMDIASSAGYNLDPNYGQLFQDAGLSSPEIMLCFRLKDGFLTNLMPRAQGSRNCNGSTVNAPTQSLIDSYEAVDGLPIDKSLVYSPKKPFENRDPRLKASIITPGSQWAGIIFQSHPDSLKVRFINGTIKGANSDSRIVSWPGAFCGYVWKKYTSESAQVLNQMWSELPFIIIRYAEPLLVYAEAKIELNQIDATVLNAINQVRARAYGVSVTNTAKYPAITTTDQSQLRIVIRRERLVEFANEGFRLFDIRRYKIAEKVMPVKVYGQILNPQAATKIPKIDNDGFVSYAGIESQYDLNTDARFPNAQNRKFQSPRDYLLPIPQREIDTYKGYGVVLTQNPGY